MGGRVVAVVMVTTEEMGETMVIAKPTEKLSE